MIREMRDGLRTMTKTEDDEKLFTNSQWRGMVREAKLQPFEVSYKRLTLKDALDVFRVAAEKERAMAYPLLKEKYKNKQCVDDNLKSYYKTTVEEYERSLR